MPKDCFPEIDMTAVNFFSFSVLFVPFEVSVEKKVVQRRFNVSLAVHPTKTLFICHD
jgi:hypothetical protein